MSMKIALALVATALVASPAAAGDPVPLDDRALDRVTAGDLGLPNGNVVFENFDNPGKDATLFVCDAIGFCHPTWNRSLQGLLNSGADGSPGIGFEGPWAAGRNDNPIECINCP